MNLFELFVKIGVDDQASGKLKDLGGKLGKGLKTAAKIGTAAVGAAAAGITALTTAAVNNYAEYEQLVGGVETLFKTSSDTVMKYAENAYKTAGMSANEYMATVTGFSAAMIQSLGGDTAKAAELSNMALTDMSDNANKMGSDLETLKTAYAGFSKQNYTMLDNLKLGYGGTKTEMERLIKDAANLDKSINANDMSFANIVKAINVVQTEMGITGTTAKEAASTIQGSVGMMKSSWENLVTGIADENAEFGTLVNNFVESASTVLDNILPRIEESLYGVDALIYRMFPIIMERIPQIISDFLPRLVETATMIVQSIVDGISQNQEMLMTTAFETITYLAESLITMLPQIVALGLDLIVSLANGIAESLPELIPTIIDVMMRIVDTLTQPETLSNLLDAALAVILALADGLVKFAPALIDATITLIDRLITFLLEPENITKLAEAAVKIVVALAEGLIKSVGTLMGSVGKLISNVVAKFKKTDWGQVGKDVVNGIWNGLKKVWNDLSGWFTEKWNGLVGGVKDLLGIHSPSRVFAGIGENMALGLGEGWEDEFGSIKKGIENEMDFGVANIDVGASMLGRNSSALNSAFSNFAANLEQNATIVVQSVLDGKIIGETAYQYSRTKAKAYGV